jgi:hypothetical protein
LDRATADELLRDLLQHRRGRARQPRPLLEQDSVEGVERMVPAGALRLRSLDLPLLACCLRVGFAAVARALGSPFVQTAGRVRRGPRSAASRRDPRRFTVRAKNLNESYACRSLFKWAPNAGSLAGGRTSPWSDRNGVHSWPSSRLLGRLRSPGAHPSLPGGSSVTEDSSFWNPHNPPV